MKLFHKTSNQIIPTIFIILFFNINAMAQDSRSYNAMWAQAKLLKVYYQKATEGKEQEKYQKLFFDSFPNTFSELNALYGHQNGPGPLYSEGLDHIVKLFNNLKHIPEIEYYSKLIGISIGGHWEADSINYFLWGLRKRVLSKPKLTIDLLASRKDEDIESFFYFFFQGLHPPFKKIPDKLSNETQSNIRISSLMKLGFDRAMTNSGH